MIVVQGGKCLYKKKVMEKSLAQLIPKNWLADKNWREISRVGSENSVGIKIYHISPLSKVDPKITQDQSLPSPNPNVTVTRVGVPTPSRPPLKDFYEGMKGAISSGFMPPEWTMQKLDNLYKQMTEAHYPEDGDFGADIEIAQFQNEEMARQQFKNMGLMPTHGFDVPVAVPGAGKMLGLSENVTFTELLESEAYEKFLSKFKSENMPEEWKGHVSKEQWEKLRSQMKGFQIEKLRSGIKKAQKQIQEEVKPGLAKAGVKYKEIKYLGCDVICAEGKNPSPPPRPRAEKLSSKDVPGGGGGFDDRFDPLPKIPQPYSEKTALYQAMLVKNFVITGGLLWAAASLLPGNTPCYSLTRFKKKTSITREGGQVFTDISFVPVVSNFAREGYLHKEEVEEIFKTLFTFLKVKYN